MYAIRTEEAEAPSSGHHPGLQRAQTIRTERAKAPSPGHHPGLQRAQTIRDLPTEFYIVHQTILIQIVRNFNNSIFLH